MKKKSVHFLVLLTFLGGIFACLPEHDAPVPTSDVILLTFKTGGDDLQGGTNNIDVTLDTEEGILLMYANLNKGERWANESTHTIEIPLNDGMNETYEVKGILLETTGKSGGDSWDLAEIEVVLKRDGFEETLFYNSGSPLHRFTTQNFFKRFAW